MTLPSTLLDWVTLVAEVIAILGILFGVLRAIYKWGFNNALHTIREANMKEGYEKIYAPIYGLFTTRHLSISYAILAPYFSMRWRNAKELLKAGDLKNGIIALFDKRRTKGGAEFEYGHMFPMGEILEIIRGNEAYADKMLLDLVGESDLSRYENPEEGECVLTDKEFQLYQYVEKRFDYLHKLFGPR